MRIAKLIVCKLSIGLLFFCSELAWANNEDNAQPAALVELSWSEMKTQNRLLHGEVVASQENNDQQVLKVAHPENQPAALELFEIHNPGITKDLYILSGRIQYDDVEGDAYLEMWSHFEDGSRYFSRTLAQSGPMQKITDSTAWREFQLPFYLGSDAGQVPPTRLAVNLVLPGKGTVYLSDVLLAEQDAAGAGNGDADAAWWSESVAGWIGGGMGAVLGGLGAVIGILSGFGVARRIVLAVLGTLIGLGVILISAGLFAVVTSQPYAVFYPLLLVGVLMTAVPAGLLPVMRRRYEQFELRRMEAADLAS
ncbi:MAG: hypothetical protein WBF93_06520 [Pirellulales bacterium]